MRRRYSAAVVIGLIGLICGVPAVPAAAAPPGGELAVGLIGGHHLVRFNTAAPGSTSAVVTITGLAPGETIHGIDVQPATGALLGLAISDTVSPDLGRLYTINPATGAAVAVGGGALIPGFADGARNSVDFNPVVDRLRVVNTADQNLRLNPNTGTVSAFDIALNPPGQQVASVAYDQNVVGTATTTLWALTAGGQLATIGGVNGPPSPNTGMLTTVGPLGVTPDGPGIGFDISGQGSVYASIRVGSIDGLYTVDLVSGAVTLVGTIGDGTLGVLDIALLPTPVPSGAAQLAALPPARLYDSRSGPALGAGTAVEVQVTGQGGVPASGVTAAVLNVTLTEASGPGYLTVWPTGQPQPTASVVNATRQGQTIAALVTVPVGAGGKVSVFTFAGGHVIVDVDAYYRPAVDGAGRFTPLVPARLLDTRTASKPVAGETLDLQVTGKGGVPNGNVGAVALNVTLTEATAPGYVTVFPQGGSAPLASSLNADVAGQTIANLVIVPVSPTGQVSLFTQSGTHLAADVVGWFSADPAAPFTTSGLFVATGPERVLDTRAGLGAPGPLLGGGTIDVEIAGHAGVPATGALAVVATVTATDSAAAGFVTAFPAGGSPPLASNLNPEGADATIANLVTVGLGNGKISLSTFAGVQLLADVAGYYLA
jgi:Domain of unknown function (DUF4394)